MKKLFSILFVAIAATTFAFAENTRVYCKMEYDWWTQSDAAIGIILDAGTATRMTYVSDYTWYADVDLENHNTITFQRVNGSGDVSDWGAQTEAQSIADNNVGTTNDFFTITNSGATWSSENLYCTGTWDTYVYTPPTIRLRGSFNSWGDSDVFTDNGETATFTKTLSAATHQFKITVDNAWTSNNTTIQRENSGTEYEFTNNVSDNAQLNADMDGEYTFTYTYATNKLSVTFPTEPVVITHTYTVAGVPSVFGSEWNSSDTNNDMTNTTGTTYTWSKEGIILAAGNVEFKVCEDHAWTNCWPVGDNNNYSLNISESGIYTISITFDSNSKEISAVATKTEEAVVVPTIMMHGNFFGEDWADTDPFAKAEGNATASLTISNLAAGNYQFGIKIDGTWTSNGVAFTRENTSAEVVSGNGNLTLKADVTGDYTFTWTYATNTLSITYPAVANQTLYFVNGYDWDLQQAYVFNGSVIYKTWPGEAMTATESSVFGKTIYSYEFPNCYNTIIFNNKHGEQYADGKQTADLVWDAAKPYFFRGEWYASVADIQNTFFITGSASLVGEENAWKETAVKVTEDSYTFENLAAGNYYELKVVYGGEWLGYAALTSVPAGVRTDADGNIAFYLAQEGDVTIAFNKATKKITISGSFAHLALNEESDNNNEAISALDGIYVPISLTRSFEAQKLYTLCLPFDVNAEDVAAILHAEKLYKLQSASVGSELLIYFDVVDAIEAGVPYLYKPAVAVTNPNFVGTVNAEASTTIERDGVSMVGFYEPTTTTGYFLGADTYLHQSSATANAFRAYFTIPGGTNNMPARIVMRGNSTTAIDQIDNGNAQCTKRIQNGQLVIIRDGKTFNALGAELR